jgi:hypothetical protein
MGRVPGLTVELDLFGCDEVVVVAFSVEESCVVEVMFGDLGSSGRRRGDLKGLWRLLFRRRRFTGGCSDIFENM